MSLKNNKYARRLAAALMTGTMMVSMLGMTAMAQGGEPVTVGFQKVLNMTDAVGASVPDVTFTYKIEKGTAVGATESTLEIKAGVGTPTVANAVFSHEDSIANNKVTEDVTVTFPEGTFTEPGIYRYVVTENNDHGNDDITNDPSAIRYLDVYVNNELKIIGSVLLKEATAPNKNSQYSQEKKSSGYENTYETYDLSLAKVVEGNMGDKGKTWSFTIEFTGPANASFKMGEEEITLDSEGKANATVSLKDADAAKVIQGIPSTVTYKITETINKSEGYTTTCTVNEVSKAMTANEEGTNVSTETITMGKADNAVVVTNARSASTPTGVILNIAPYILMVALAGVLAFFFLRKRRYDL